MTITTYLLITLAAFSIIGGWTLAAALGHAVDGYEDASGFCFGALPALPMSLLHPQVALAPASEPAKAPVVAAPHFSTGTATQSVTIFVSTAGRAASPLYRRYHRSGHSSSPFPVQSASPFPVQSASPFPVQSASPFPAQSASPFSTQSASPFPVDSASPFALQGTTARANQTGSNSPFPSNSKPASGERSSV